MTITEPEKGARIYRQFDLYLEQAGRIATRGAHVRIVSEANRAARALANGAGDAAALAEVLDGAWADYLARVWIETVTTAGGLMADILSGGKVDSGVFDRIGRLYADRHARARGAGIAETSRNAIAASIARGQDAGETLAEVGRRIVADAGSAATWRGATIGSTEAHAAGYCGAWNAAVQTLRGWIKVWAAPRAAGVTCDQHKSAHGQRRPLRDAFDVANDYEAPDATADKLQYPGDGERGARASNVINCRCGMEFQR